MNPLVSSPAIPAPPALRRPPRSTFVTALAGCVIAAGAVGSLVSLAALLMIAVGSGGMANANPSEGFVVIGVPPLTCVAGISLWRRWRWAHVYVLLLCAGVAGWNLASIVRGPTSQYTYVSPGAVPTTVLESNVNYPVHVFAIVVALGVCAKLLTRSVRTEFTS